MADEDRWGEADYWQLPSTTIQLGTGDCEDQAILLTSLIRAAGVPRERVHLVYGYVYTLGFFAGAHCWVEVKLGTGSLEEASEAIAPYVGDELVLYTNVTSVKATLTQEKLEEIQALGGGARDGWIPLDTAFFILEWPIEIPVPFESWVWFGYYTYWLALSSAEPKAFYVDPPQPVILTVNPPSVCIGETVTISVGVSDADWHDWKITVIKPSGSLNSQSISLQGGTSQSFTYGTDWGATTDEIGTYTIRVSEYWYDPILGSVTPSPRLREEIVGEITFSTFSIHVIPEPSVLFGTLLMLAALATFYFTKAHSENKPSVMY